MGAITPAMTAGMAFLLLGTTEQPLTYATLVPVMLGIIISAGFEPSFHGFGFLASMGASSARAFKAVLQVPFRRLSPSLNAFIKANIFTW